MIPTDNPFHDFYVHDAEETEWLNSRPVCDECGEPIQDDFGYRYEGNLLCADCWDKLVNREIKVDIDTLID